MITDDKLSLAVGKKYGGTQFDTQAGGTAATTTSVPYIIGTGLDLKAVQDIGGPGQLYAVVTIKTLPSGGTNTAFRFRVLATEQTPPDSLLSGVTVTSRYRELVSSATVGTPAAWSIQAVQPEMVLVMAIPPLMSAVWAGSNILTPATSADAVTTFRYLAVYGHNDAVGHATPGTCDVAIYTEAAFRAIKTYPAGAIN